MEAIPYFFVIAEVFYLYSEDFILPQILFFLIPQVEQLTKSIEYSFFFQNQKPVSHLKICYHV